MKLMMNIITSVPIRPIRHVCHVKYLNVGRKFGAPVNSMPKQAKLVAMYESKKRTELICAIKFNDPISRMTSTSVQLIKTATIGLFLYVPRVTKSKIFP